MGRDRTQSRDRSVTSSSNSTLQSRGRVQVGFGGQNDVQVSAQAGLCSYNRFMDDIRQMQGSGKSRVAGPQAYVKKDLSLLQPNQRNQLENMRVNPAELVPAAGLVARARALADFMENGQKEPSEAIRALPQHAPTDPLTFFRHEGLDIRTPDRPTKRGNYNARSTKQTWTWAQDPSVKAALGMGGLPPRHIIEQKFVFAADGTRGYNMWGEEDLLVTEGRDAIKHERQVPLDHLVYNDKQVFPYCWRDELDYHEKRPEHGHWQSGRIWDVMHDDAYAKVLKGQSPEPGQTLEFRRRSRERKKKKRSSKSLPPHLSTSAHGLREVPSATPSSSGCSSVSMASRSIRNPPKKMEVSGKATDLTTDWSHWPLPGHGHRAPVEASIYPPEPPQVSHEHGSRAPDTRLRYVPSVKPWNDPPSQKPVAASEPARRSSAKSLSERSRGGSSCMSPLSITNAMVASRKDSMPRSATARDLAPRAQSARKLARSASK